MTMKDIAIASVEEMANHLADVQGSGSPSPLACNLTAQAPAEHTPRCLVLPAPSYPSAANGFPSFAAGVAAAKPPAFSSSDVNEWDAWCVADEENAFNLRDLTTAHRSICAGVLVLCKRI